LLLSPPLRGIRIYSKLKSKDCAEKDLQSYGGDLFLGNLQIKKQEIKFLKKFPPIMLSRRD
jgi:hypothetical protein